MMNGQSAGGRGIKGNGHFSVPEGPKRDLSSELNHRNCENVTASTILDYRSRLKIEHRTGVAGGVLIERTPASLPFKISAVSGVNDHNCQSSRRKSSRFPLRDFKDTRRIGLA